MEIRGVPPMNYLHMTATEINKKDEKIQCAVLLSLLGPPGIKIFNTFQIAEADLCQNQSSN